MPHRISPGDSVLARYRALAQEGKIDADAAQEEIAERLDELNADIGQLRLASKSSSLGWLFAKRAPKRETVRGLYIHGSVGRGKTMLMDFFFNACPYKRKRRVHFNDFMDDVHRRIGAHRKALKAGEVREDDPVAPTARAIAGEARVLCFDEFAVTDIADAMILSRLFTALFAEGVVLVATSNVAPDNLYRDGLNRGLFLPFIETLKAHVDVVSLDSQRDYRLGRLMDTPRYLTPLGPETDAAMDAIWSDLTDGADVRPTQVTVKGRNLPVACAGGGAARFTFAELCETPLGANDYLAIADAFQTIVLEQVPVIEAHKRNEAKRFILLIDTLYDRKVRLFVSAAADPFALYAAETGTEAFEFERTSSRLQEMRSDDWLVSA